MKRKPATPKTPPTQKATVPIRLTVIDRCPFCQKVGRVTEGEKDYCWKCGHIWSLPSKSTTAYDEPSHPMPHGMARDLRRPD